MYVLDQLPRMLRPDYGFSCTILEKQAAHKRLLADALIVFHDKRSSSRQAAVQTLTQFVGRLAVVQGADDIQTVVEKLHVPHASKSGIDAIITDLDPKVNISSAEPG